MPFFPALLVGEYCWHRRGVWCPFGCLLSEPLILEEGPGPPGPSQQMHTNEPHFTAGIPDSFTPSKDRTTHRQVIRGVSDTATKPWTSPQRENPSILAILPLRVAWPLTVTELPKARYGFGVSWQDLGPAVSLMKGWLVGYLSWNISSAGWCTRCSDFNIYPPGN